VLASSFFVTPEKLSVSTTTAAPLKKTPLNDAHRRMGARMVDFGGWDMPVEYSGIIAEHLAVRTAAGLFDVSHMGEIEIRGPRALDLVQKVSCNNAAKLAVGQAHYSGLMTEQGTFVDDLLVHKLSDTHYLLCVNASNQDKDYAYICEHNDTGAEVENAGPRYAQLALQGPESQPILARLTKAELAAIKYYHFTFGDVCGVRCLIARTGYTGEDGFELYGDPQHAEKVWNDLLEAGKPDGLIPCGLGARNTLRLEAGMALYGHEIDDATTVWEAGLDWICKLDKGDFLGRDALLWKRSTGLRRKLVGFEMQDRMIARDGYPVYWGGRQVGNVTSGSPSPLLKKNIGMAYVPVEIAVPDAAIQIEIRGQKVPARIVPLPFYKRAR
jgi:aminomethyltransferase